MSDDETGHTDIVYEKDETGHTALITDKGRGVKEHLAQTKKLKEKYDKLASKKKEKKEEQSYNDFKTEQR